MSSFYALQSGAMMVAPGGQTETGAPMHAAGMAWTSVNCADGHAWSDWSATIVSAQNAGLRVAVGGRVRNLGDPLDGARMLLEIGATQKRPVILNIEDEFKTVSPASFQKVIHAVRLEHPLWRNEVVISTVGWLYNDVNYAPLRYHGVLLQVYPTDMHIGEDDIPRVTQDCIAHAVIKGFPRANIGVSFEAGDHQPEPGWYDFWGSRPRSYFTGDWIGARSAWAEWAVPL